MTGVLPTIFPGTGVIRAGAVTIGRRLADTLMAGWTLASLADGQTFHRKVAFKSASMAYFDENSLSDLVSAFAVASLGRPAIISLGVSPPVRLSDSP